MFAGNKTELDITKGTSEYEGWGTSMKPSQELICVARKPLSEPTVAANVLKWGTGGINIDGSRIGSEKHKVVGTNISGKIGENQFDRKGDERNYEGMNKEVEGRWPANIIFECICDEVIKGEKGEIKKRDKLNNHNGHSVFNTNIKGSENYDYKDKNDSY